MKNSRGRGRGGSGAAEIPGLSYKGVFSCNPWGANEDFKQGGDQERSGLRNAHSVGRCEGPGGGSEVGSRETG